MKIPLIATPAGVADLPIRTVASWPGWRVYLMLVSSMHLARYLMESIRLNQTLVFESMTDWLDYETDELIRMIPAIIATSIALKTIEHRKRRRPYRTAFAFTSIAVAAVTGALASTYFLPYEPWAVRTGASVSIAVWFWYSLWMALVIGILSLIFFDSLGIRQEAQTRLAQVQDLERSMRVKLAFAQLLSIQARVDPQLLFDMLGAVKRFYERDIDRAETLLEELSNFLRAALPRLRSSRSTLQVEFDIVRIYASMLNKSDGPGVDFESTLPDDLAAESFPPGILMPLLVDSIDVERTIRLDALFEKSALVIRIVDSRRPNAGRLEQLRRSLAVIYGDRFQLRVREGGSRLFLELELPRESS